MYTLLDFDIYKQLPIELPILEGLVTPTIDDMGMLIGIELLSNLDYLKDLNDRDVFYGLDVCMYVMYVGGQDKSKLKYHPMLNELDTICTANNIKIIKELLYRIGNMNYPNFKYFTTLLQL